MDWKKRLLRRPVTTVFWLLLSEVLYSKLEDSISFLAANNRELDDLSQIASEMFGAVDPKAPAFTDGVALTIHDQQYRATVTALAQNIRRSGYRPPLPY